VNVIDQHALLALRCSHWTYSLRDVVWMACQAPWLQLVRYVGLLWTSDVWRRQPTA